MFDKAASGKTDLLTVQLPTGYGKTYTAVGVYSILKAKGFVDKCLYIVPRDAQKEQLCCDGKYDMLAASVTGSHQICDVSYAGPAAFKANKKGCQFFVCLIQGLNAEGPVWDVVSELMSEGNWMVVVDEHHHIGNDKAWGKAIDKLPRKFLLAMSATPNRPGDDSPFKGEADIQISYRQAVKENAVKPMVCHSYVYRIDAITEDGDVKSFTTSELVEEAGSDQPEKIERLRIERKMRWSPKYVSPLVAEPIIRMGEKRLRSGHRLQVLVTAMCCSHAELVCEQLRLQHPHLEIDWVGTGENGRPSSENRKILERFCPPKKEGKRRREDIGLDVLVHVGLAGEGLDSVNVCEIVHLHRANITNTNNQINGRGARYLEDVVCHINVDSSSEYAKHIGGSVMNVMDDNNAPATKDPGDFDPEKWEPVESIPDWPQIQLWDLELEEIETGASQMVPFVLSRSGYDKNDPRVQEDAEHFYREMRRKEAEMMGDKSIIQQWSDAVDAATGIVCHLVIRMKMKSDSRYEKSLPGDIKKKINSRKKHLLGQKVKDVEVLQRHYAWLKSLEKQIVRTREVPTWLV